jgi:hypothetical protein
MLNPFAQQSAVVAVVRNEDTQNADVLGAIIKLLFAEESLPSNGEDPIWLITDSVPTTLDVVWDDPAFTESVRQALVVAPSIRRLDIDCAIWETREFAGRPWDRATAQLEGAYSRRRSDGLAPSLNPDVETSDAAILEWFDLMTQGDDWVSELLQFPKAWHGAIDNAVPELAQTAFTYWQLDAFLCSYGYPRMRELVAAWARLEEEQAAAESGHVSRLPPDVPERPADLDGGWSYRTAYSNLQRQLEGFDPTRAQPRESVYAFAGSVVAAQLAAAEESLGGSAEATRELRRLMRKTWALGYCLGASFGMIERFEIPRESTETHNLIAEIHKLGLGPIASQELLSLSRAASQKTGEEFSEGLMSGGRDVIAFANRGEEAGELLQWIRSQVSR